MHIPLIYVHLFYKYFVRRSDGQATKGRNVKCGKSKIQRASLFMDVVILVFLVREVFNTIAKEDAEFLDGEDSDFEVILKVKGRIRNSGLFRIFTYTDDGLF